MHALQALVANFEPLNDLHLNLHELNILNLLANILAWELYISLCQKNTHSFAHIFTTIHTSWSNIKANQIKFATKSVHTRYKNSNF